MWKHFTTAGFFRWFFSPEDHSLEFALLVLLYVHISSRPTYMMSFAFSILKCKSLTTVILWLHPLVLRKSQITNFTTFSNLFSYLSIKCILQFLDIQPPGDWFLPISLRHLCIVMEYIIAFCPCSHLQNVTYRICID